MWLCCQRPWRWWAKAGSVWSIDEHLGTFTELGADHPLVLSRPRWVLVTPWLVMFYFTRVRQGQQRLSARWWCCCQSWTDAVAFARCRRLAMLWREHRR
jgi:hypothetical protein